MKAYEGSEYIDPHFIEVGTSWRWVMSFTPLPLYPRFPLDRGGWVGPRADLGYLERDNYWLYRDSNSNPSVVQLVVSRYTDSAILRIWLSIETSGRLSWKPNETSDSIKCWEILEWMRTCCFPRRTQLHGDSYACDLGSLSCFCNEDSVAASLRCREQVAMAVATYTFSLSLPHSLTQSLRPKLRM
jgi:hypothetical protein